MSGPLAQSAERAHGRLHWQYYANRLSFSFQSRQVRPPCFSSYLSREIGFLVFLVNFNGIVIFYLYIVPVWIKVFMEILCVATYPSTESLGRTVTFTGSIVQTVLPLL